VILDQYTPPWKGSLGRSYPPGFVQVIIQKHRGKQAELERRAPLQLLDDLPGAEILFVGIGRDEVEVELVGAGLDQELAAAALVKKVVFDEVQFFPTNSTMPSGMCVKPEKSFELTRPEGAVELRANAAEGRKRGDAMGRASWHSPFLGHPGAKFFRYKAKKIADIMRRARGRFPFRECRTQLWFSSQIQTGFGTGH